MNKNQWDRCQRCRKRADSTTMSRFNTQMICCVCEEKEIAHPNYDRAVEEELRAVHSGDFNYPGVGLPKDLYPN